MTTFTIDTSSLIDAHIRSYPRDIFPSVWNEFDGMIECGDLVAIEEVYHELSRQDDGIAKWLRDQDGMLHVPDQTVQEALRDQVIPAFGTGYVPGRRNTADPWIIAHAVAIDGTVITQETRSADPRSRKIPNVCETVGVPCTDLVGLVRSLGRFF